MDEQNRGLVIVHGASPNNLSLGFMGKLQGYIVHMTPGLVSTLKFHIDGVECEFIPLPEERLAFIPTGTLAKEWASLFE